jgi:hypothetical protein
VRWAEQVTRTERMTEGSYPCARYEGIQESEGVTPLILKFGTYIRLVIRFMLRPFLFLRQAKIPDYVLRGRMALRTLKFKAIHFIFFGLAGNPLNLRTFVVTSVSHFTLCSADWSCRKATMRGFRTTSFAVKHFIE